MYTRSFHSDEGIKIPDHYNGTSLLNQAPSEPSRIAKELPRGEMKISPTEESIEEEVCACEAISEQTNAREKSDILKGIFAPIGRLFPSLTAIIAELGTEEILLIGLALFLFFSESGDRECALILLALIFIK